MIQQTIKKANSNIGKDQVWQLYGASSYQLLSKKRKKEKKKIRTMRTNYKNEQSDYNLGEKFNHRACRIEPNNQDNILPNKNKSVNIWNRKTSFKSQKSIGIIYQIKYQKIHQNSSQSQRKKSNIQFSTKNSNNQNLKITKKPNLSQSKQIQRAADSGFNKSKASAFGSASTKTATQLAPHPYRQFEVFNNKRNNNRQSTASCLLQKIDNKIKTLPQKNCINVIVQQSSQSKISRTIRNNSIGSHGSRSSIDPKSGGSLRSSFKNSIFLPLNSNKNYKKFQQISNASELEGYIVIQNYLEMLTVLANYAHQITQNYQNTQDWEELIFLTYKKYYLSRLKLFNALFYRNTLFFESFGVKLSSAMKKSLKFFMNSQNGQILRKEIFRQNAQIADSLRNIYNLAIQKSGNYINLVEVDNFSCQIFRLMAQEIEQLQENYFKDPQTVKNRLKVVMKCALTIIKLDGKFQIQQSLTKLMSGSISMKLFQNLVKQIKLKLV